MPSLNANTIESIEFKYPSQKEQQAIASILSEIDEEIEALEQKRAKYQLLENIWIV